MSSLKHVVSSIGGIIGACGGAVSVISLALSFFWVDAAAPYVLMFLGASVFVGSVIAQNFRLTNQLIPGLRVRCGEDIGTVSRNHTRKLVSGDTAIVDFFGFELTNSGAQPITNCRATLVRIERRGEVVWSNPIALTFEPHSSTETEPIECVTLVQNVSRRVCLLSTMLTTRDQFVHPGSLGMTSRHGADFWIALNDRANYMLIVRVSGDGISTIEERFIFDKTAESSFTTIRRP